MDETKSDQGETRKGTEEAAHEKNQLFEQMMDEGLLDNFFKDLPPREQEEWRDFSAKTMEPYDRLICMIREVTSTQKGRDELHDEIRKKTVEEVTGDR